VCGEALQFGSAGSPHAKPPTLGAPQKQQESFNEVGESFFDGTRFTCNIFKTQKTVPFYHMFRTMFGFRKQQNTVNYNVLLL
jgi:hypothetical protein